MTFYKPDRKPFQDCRSTALRMAFLFVSFLFSLFAFSQPVGEFKVKMIAPEGYSVGKITVSIQIDKRSLKGKTDNTGVYQFKLPIYNDSLRIRLLTESPFYAPIDTLLTIRAEKDIELSLSPANLREVSVVGYKKIVKTNAEKQVFNIDLGGLLQSAKANLALKRVPGIIYTDKGYQLAGNGKAAKLLIDGIETTETELGKIMAGDIAKVEVRRIGLNDEASSGEINVILKRNRANLLKGEIAAGTQLSRAGFNLSPSATYRSGKIDLIFWSSYTQDRQKGKNILYRDEEEFLFSEYKNRLQQYSGALKTNIRLSPKWETALNYSIFGYKAPADVVWRSKGVSQTAQYNKESYFSHFVNAVIAHDINANKRLFFKARYFNYATNNETAHPYTLYKGKMNEWTGEILLEADSIRFLRDYHNIAVGIKSIYRNTLLTASRLPYRSDVQQLYMKDQFSLNKWFDVFLLLRGEWYGFNFQRTGSTRRLAVLPTISVNYNGKIGSFSFVYNRHIERPSVDFLNPEVFYINEYEKSQGNVHLRPQYADRYTLNYSRQIGSGFLTSNVVYERIGDMIGGVYMTDYSTSTYENAGKGRILNLNIGYSKPLFKHALNLNLNITADHTAYKIAPAFAATALSEGNEGWGLTSTMNLSYMAPKQWFLELMLMHRNNERTLNSTVHNKIRLDLTVTKSLCNDRLDLSLFYYDMFGLFRKQRVRYKLKGLTQISKVYSPSSFLGISLTWRFGKDFKIQSVGEVINNEDIRTK